MVGYEPLPVDVDGGVGPHAVGADRVVRHEAVHPHFILGSRGHLTPATFACIADTCALAAVPLASGLRLRRAPVGGVVRAAVRRRPRPD